MQHGENWGAIASVLSKKSANQVRNYVRGKAELLAILEERKSQMQPADQPPLIRIVNSGYPSSDELIEPLGDPHQLPHWVRWRLPSTNKT